LIEPPFPKALGMERDRQNEVKIREGKFRVPVFGQKTPQGSGEPRNSPVFEAADGLHDQPFVEAYRTGPGKIGLFREATGAKVVPLRRGDKTDSAAGTAGRGEKFDPGEADRAGAILELTSGGLAAEEAFGRQEEIQKSAPEGSRNHNLAGKL
jgi:hypothetical protein